MRAADFLDTLGVNTHVGFDPYNDPAKVASMLSYLGVENVRQNQPHSEASMAAVQALGKLGAKMDLLVNGNGPVEFAGVMASIKQLAPYLNAIENVNEVAIWPIQYKGLNGVDAAIALQKDLYAAVKADPALSKLPVYMFTIGGANPDAYPQIGDLSAYTDYANVHAYAPDGMRPLWTIPAAIAGGRTGAPSKPVVVTETGYYTLPRHTAWGGVPEAVQASYTLNVLLDGAAGGVSRTYIYDLMDDGKDPNEREHHFGLFRYDGTPKPSATAIHNMTALLADTGANRRSFVPGEFSYTATGVPYNYTGNTMLLQKSDGTHTVAVWNEQQLWNPKTQTATEVQHVPVTVDLHKPHATVQVFDPMVGTSPVQTLHDVSRVQLDLTDHPLFIQVPPAPGPGGDGAVSGGGQGVDTASGTAVTPASNALVLHVSGDAWLGDARFKVTVDGRRIGGTYTATASHAAGQSQAVSLDVGLEAGAHTLAVTFLNDAWGGTASTDRNLYVDGVEWGGQRLVGAQTAMLRNGTWTHAFTAVPAGGLSAASGTAATSAREVLAAPSSTDAW